MLTKDSGPGYFSITVNKPSDGIWLAIIILLLVPSLFYYIFTYSVSLPLIGACLAISAFLYFGAKTEYKIKGSRFIVTEFPIGIKSCDVAVSDIDYIYGKKTSNPVNRYNRITYFLSVKLKSGKDMDVGVSSRTEQHILDVKEYLREHLREFINE